jgi:hypothetical protein
LIGAKISPALVHVEIGIIHQAQMISLTTLAQMVEFARLFQNLVKAADLLKSMIYFSTPIVDMVYFFSLTVNP